MKQLKEFLSWFGIELCLHPILTNWHEQDYVSRNYKLCKSCGRKIKFKKK